MKKSQLVATTLVITFSVIAYFTVNNLCKCRQFYMNFNSLRIGDSLKDVRHKMKADEVGVVSLDNENIYYFESPCFTAKKITPAGSIDFENATEPPDPYGYVQVFASDQKRS